MSAGRAPERGDTEADERRRNEKRETAFFLVPTCTTIWFSAGTLETRNLKLEAQPMSTAPQPQKSGTFGERLRREREMRGIKLEEISESTKIGKRNLIALEEERFEQLPGGIFNKGFVRAYAKFLGLDEEQAVNDFLAASANSEQPAALAPSPALGSPASAAYARAAAGRASPAAGRGGVADETSVVKPAAMPSDAAVARRQRLWALVAALVLVMGLALWFKPAVFGIEKLRARHEPLATARASSAPASKLPAQDQSASLSQQANPPEKRSESAVPKAGPSQEAAIVSSASSAAAPPTNAQPSAQVTSKPAASPVSSASRTASARDAEDSITLSLHATSEVWVSAMSDGVSILNFTLQPGQSRQLRASNHLILKTGNAAALDVTFNGKPLPPLGKDGQVRTLTFTPSGLQ